MGIKKRRKDDLFGNMEEYFNIYLFFLDNWQSLHPDYEAYQPEDLNVSLDAMLPA